MIKKFIMHFTIVLIVAFFATGCAPLKKKFIRQKKKSEEVSKLVPLLEPQEYPAPDHNPERLFAQHSALWRVWYKDLTTAIEEGNEKKQRYNLDQMLAKLDGMSILLKDEKRLELELLRTRLSAIRANLDEPIGFRNYTSITNNLRGIDRAVRNDFNPKKLEGQFIQ